MSAEPVMRGVAAARRRACVLDASLALSPFGLPLAQRLSAELELWLVRELWQILDNTTLYADEPERLFGAAAAPGDPDALRHVLRQWDLARGESDLAGLQIYWLGDGLGGSLLPPGLDAHVIARYERLARALDRRAEDPVDPIALENCARDAVALTVALAPSRAVLLTTRLDRGRTREEPPLCASLRRWGIPVCAVDGGGTARLERESLEQLLTRSGAAELLWAGLDLVPMHIVARRAAAIPTFGASTMLDDDESIAVDDTDETDWWADAVAFWYPLTEEHT